MGGLKHGAEFEEQQLDMIANSLQQHGYVVLTDVVSDTLLQSLHLRVQNLAPKDWKSAGIGREQGHHINSQVRSDHIHWITPDDPVEKNLLAWMEALRSGLNRRLFMGLFEFEAHFSRYPEGAFYQKHLDALSGRSNRILSAVLYLNRDWQKEDAGELLLYPEEGGRPISTILPKLGTFVLFLSEQFPHEVKKAHRERISIAGWFRGAESC
ncbi:MAG: 2OG-Fe(II) oxygenase [Kordiimonadaceae bacterium]|nr:2OG-Fe(II) oxygenase [Kordiimonadaceae bacterium]